MKETEITEKVGILDELSNLAELVHLDSSEAGRRILIDKLLLSYLIEYQSTTMALSVVPECGLKVNGLNARADYAIGKATQYNNVKCLDAAHSTVIEAKIKLLDFNGNPDADKINQAKGQATGYADALKNLSTTGVSKSYITSSQPGYRADIPLIITDGLYWEGFTRNRTVFTIEFPSPENWQEDPSALSAAHASWKRGISNLIMKIRG